MSYTASYGFGPHSTPKVIKHLIGATCLVSVFCALVNILFTSYLNMPGPQQILSLSLRGLSQGYIWQPLSYFFVQSSGHGGLSLYFLLELFLNMYILWTIGSNLAEHVGQNAFARFYLLLGVLIGMATLLTMPLIRQSALLAGATAPILATLLIWSMMHPESQVYLFFSIAIKAKWLITAIFAFMILSSISRLDLTTLTLTLYSFLFAYLYATMVWKLESPFAWTHFIDRVLHAISFKVAALFKRKTSSPLSSDRRKKIIDFHTGKPVLDDEHFMDTVLEKISKYGEQSLSWSERHRMKKISEKKARLKEEADERE